jgi:sec-independent protein translocase protein TatA
MEGLLSPTHLVFILLIVLILFGPGKLPELGKGLGKGIREFKSAMRGEMDGSSDAKSKEDTKAKEEEKKPEEVKKA